jgi:hypothetical protein
MELLASIAAVARRAKLDYRFGHEAAELPPIESSNKGHLNIRIDEQPFRSATRTTMPLRDDVPTEGHLRDRSFQILHHTSRPLTICVAGA